MYRTYTTAPITSLPGFRFTQTQVLTFGRGIIVTHAWEDTTTGVDGGGYDTKAEAVRGARAYRKARDAERRTA
jgi:hypothetical protein